MDTLGALIRQARLRYGMGQAELARRIGIHPISLYDIERGKTLDPKFSIVARIANVLQISLDTLRCTKND